MRLVMLIMMGIAGQWTLPEAMAQPAPPVAVSNDDGGTVVSADPESEPEPAMEPRVHRVYVPASELHAVLKKDVRGVLLSRDEFRRLWHAAMRARESQPRQPAEVVISAANLSARIEGEQLLLTGELEFTQFQRGWQILRIPVGGLSVERAAIDGETAAVYRDGEQPDTLLVFSQNEGEHRLSLDMSAELTPLGSDLLAEFALSGAPSGTLRLALPADQSLRVDGLAVSPSGGTEPDYRIPIGGRSRISLRITGGDASESVDSLLFAKTAYGLMPSR